ncbi:alpha/beta hydrolase fold domain-containing protein [Nocardioides sp.]|uniref:alpha/beta hydrolase fold domain-containing protein n=1 Tax=Nocardioides sp. TaxID=35761 RepID=UPI002B26AD62|nr:alpha/beta hydrolase fold domain-containing protein [Nocardioides sp.]
MPSTAHRAFVLALGLIPGRVIDKALTQPARRKRSTVAPKSLATSYDVTETSVAGRTVVTARPRSGGEVGAGLSTGLGTGRHLFYLHGGAYTVEDNHWSLLRLLVDRGWTVHLYDYPLAPEHTVDETVPATLEAWSHVVELADGAPVDLAGDSAGGGLATVLLQVLRDRDVPRHERPARTVLFSPWVELVMDDAATIAAAKDDVLLSLTGLRGCVDLYRGTRDASDPWLSPIHGGLHDLGEIQAWVGTAEMFQPQCERFADLAAGAPDTDLELRLGHDLLHAWPIFPVPEQKLVVDEMATFLTR